MPASHAPSGFGRPYYRSRGMDRTTRRKYTMAEDNAIQEHSAGGVVLKGHGGNVHVAVMQSRYGTWVFPKGGLECGEEPEQTAKREIAEEIGIRDARMIVPLGLTEHEYRREGSLRRKKVDWFLFRAPAEATLRPDLNENSLDCGWFIPEQALILLSHDSQRRILRRALKKARGEKIDT